MSESKFGQTQCVVNNCKTTAFNRNINITFHKLPTTSDMQNRWFNVLKNRCASIDFNKSRICSKHFENRHFDSQRQLKSNAIPTLFPIFSTNQKTKTMKSSDYSLAPPTKIDKVLNTLTQTELHNDIKNRMQQLQVPDTLSSSVTDDLQCLPNASNETQLWLLVKKQDHLITRLMQAVLQNKKHVEVLQKNMEESRTEKKEMEQSLEYHKYISKCLQEKQATLEEQVEILTAVESRT